MSAIPIRLGRKRHCLAHALGAVGIALNCARKIRARATPRRAVMLLEPFGLGDIVSLEPLIRVLKQDRWTVKVCAKNQWKPLIPPDQIDDWLQEQIPWTSYDEGQKYRLDAFKTPVWREFIQVLRQSCEGAIGIDCRGDIRSVLLLRWAGCREIWSLSHYLGSDLRMTPGAARTVRDDGTLRRWELNLEFAKALGVKLPAKVPPPDAGHLLAGSEPGGDNAVGLIPVAPWRGRLWPAAKWQSLADHLRRRDFQVVGFHGPGQEALAGEMLGPYTRLVEASSVPDWAAKLVAVRRVISLDSGPLHLADALGLPVVGLYGSGKLPLWAPSGPRSRALHHQERPGYYPCHQIAANIELGRKYMDWIEVDEVLAAIDNDNA